MDEQNRNLLLAMVLSAVVLFIWFAIFPPPAPVDPATLPAETAADVPGAVPGVDPATPQGTPDAAPTSTEAARVPVRTPALSGSISLQGGRIDDLSLLQYQTTIEDDAPNVHLLNPIGNADDAYYGYFGWAPGGDLAAGDVPGPDTVWQLDDGETLTPETPVTIRWDSPKGLIFRRVISVDDAYLFTVAQSVENPTDTAVRLAPYGVVARHGEPDDLMGFFILHEGVIRMVDGTLEETDYDDVVGLDADPLWGASSEAIEATENGWIGFTDHYWQTTLMPEPGTPFTAVTQYVAGSDVYRVVTRLATVEVAPGASATSTQSLFAGAKEWEVIDRYQETLGFERFEDSIDWGIFYILTKPIFRALHWLNGLIGNMGLAIIGLTLIIKAILFPLAYKSYVSMARMKELQPEMEKLKERVGDDRQKMQQEMMALYKKEKVNPASGCLPILLQIPIFFSLYKVIFVTLDLRHAPFFGPFQDLSAPDPTSIFNFYGLLPWGAPEPGTLLALVFIGILPLLLGISMWLQQKLNPAPTDPTQQMIFAWMPWVFMFMLGSFASGLVVYWIANNVITFTQQYTIMLSHGSRPDLLGNIRGKKQPDAKPANKPGAPKAKAEPVETPVDVDGEAETETPDQPSAGPSGSGNKPRRRRKKRK